ncbi:MAG: diaminopimelate epimerase [Actinomycetota bacterium]|nr:diaminopimelate epimerase [Actinomycetota bacterium]
MSFPFVKGHGTHNDFVVLPDLDGAVHGDLRPEIVAAICDRRAGIGADGVLRVLRRDVDGGAGWFMDYRNADGSVSQMCGNGLRVFARYLAAAGLVDPATLAGPLAVATRDGVKQVAYCDDGEISVDMGAPKVGGPADISFEGRHLVGSSVDMGNPHAVVVVDALEEAGELGVSPISCVEQFPDGVNVEFVRVVGDRDLEMRVFERGVGETWSCGTGACAVVASVASLTAAPAGTADVAPGRRAGSPANDVARSPREAPATYSVSVRGGRLTVTWDVDGHLHLKGPAVLVATGTWTV